MKFRKIGNIMGEMPKFLAGLQLYTLRNEMKEDFFGTLKKVADIGYKTVEFAGYYNIPAKEIAKFLNQED